MTSLHNSARLDLRVNGDRLWQSLMDMAAIGAGAHGGCNRQALTDADKQGRDTFVDWARAAGCTIEVDAVGNIYARRAGTDPDAAPVAMSSHLDTQATGGRFDGVYGVLAGIEVLRVLAEHDIATRHPLEVICWTNEEGCRFAPAMLGSGVVSGAYDLDVAYTSVDKDGLSLRDELARIGYLGTAPAEPRPFAAMIEAHIEQGPILERENITIGVVTGIQGAYWFDIVITGQSCHAGPTPMEMRLDPWQAALPILAEAYAIAQAHAPDARCTVGDVVAHPGSRNTVPDKLTLSIDIRHPDAATLDAMASRLKAAAIEHGTTRGLGVSITEIWHMPPTRFAPALVDLVEAGAQTLGLSHRRMVSGAGHDSLHTATFAPTTMIFVPCAGGLSHNEAEAAEPADLAAGADLLLQTVLAVAMPI